MEPRPSESVLLLRLRAGMLERALDDLKKNESVRVAEPTLGPYDVIVTANLKDEASLQAFAKGLQSQEYVAGLELRMPVRQWTREGAADKPLHGWTFIHASNPDAAMKALQAVATVNRVYQLTGEFNVLATLAVDDPTSLVETVTRDVQRIEGVRRTETLTGIARLGPAKAAGVPGAVKA